MIMFAPESFPLGGFLSVTIFSGRLCVFLDSMVSLLHPIKVLSFDTAKKKKEILLKSAFWQDFFVCA